MATVSNPNAAVKAGNGLGVETRIYSVATGTISVADAVAEISKTATVAAVEGTADGSHIAVQGGLNSVHAAIGGVTLVATFNDDAQNGGV